VVRNQSERSKWLFSADRSERVQGFLDTREERAAEYAQRLAGIQATAETLRGVRELADKLNEALLREDRTLLLAVFMEWHRRDPQGVFAEIGRRPAAWSDLDGNLLAAFVSSEEFAAEYRNPARNEEYIRLLMQGQGAYLGNRGDLEHWSQMLGVLDGDNRIEMADQFCDNWVPDDPKAAARYIMNELPEGSKRAVLEVLSAERLVASPLCMTDAFQQALLAQNWSDFKVERDRLAEGICEASCGGLFNRPPNFTADEMTEDRAARSLEDLMKYFLPGEKDTPALLFRHEVNLDEIRAEMAATVEGIDRFPEEFDAALFRRFLSADPEAAVAWGTQRLPAERLRALAMESMSGDTRASASQVARLSDAAVAIPGWDGKAASQIKPAAPFPITSSPSAGWQKPLLKGE